MIHELTNLDVWPTKRNFIDQNKVVFGYDNHQECCESWGMGVYDPETHKLVAESPAGLPYHFDFTRGAQDLRLNSRDRHKSFCFYHSEEYLEVLDVTQVYLLPDNGTDRELVLEAYTDHNGYYMHDYSLFKTTTGNATEGGAK